MNFWERLKEQIRKENTTQEWVSGKIGVSYRTFNGWFSRKIMPNAEQAVGIAQALGVTVEYLVTGNTDSLIAGLTREERECLELIQPLDPPQVIEIKGVVRSYIQQNFQNNSDLATEQQIS